MITNRHRPRSHQGDANLTEGAPLLELPGVSRVIGAVREPSGGRLQGRPRKVTAVAGDRGAGPSVLTQTVSGLWEPTEGQIPWRGETVQYTAPLAHSGAL